MFSGELQQPWKFLNFSATSALVSYKLVSYKNDKKECILLWMGDTSVVVCFFYLCHLFFFLYFIDSKYFCFVFIV